MTRAATANPSPEAGFVDPTGAPQARTLAAGADWTLSEFICHNGPNDRPFEEQHDWFSMAAVMSGHFNYKTAQGRAMLQPGSWLLGNHGNCFECGHDHGVGDRCVALRLSPAWFDEVACSTTACANYHFSMAALPPLPALLPLLARMEALAQGSHIHDKLALEQSLPELVATLVGTATGHKPTQRAPSAHDEKRISRALEYMTAHAQDDIGLDDLAGAAAMSKYHFLRTFQQTVGVTPHQYLLNQRLRNAALGLATTTTAVSQLAYGSGFNDLSTFNHTFKRVFGASPQNYRNRMV